MGIWGVTRAGQMWKKTRGQRGHETQRGSRSRACSGAERREETGKVGQKRKRGNGASSRGDFKREDQNVGKGEGVEVGASIHEAGLESSMSMVASEGWQW